MSDKRFLVAHLAIAGKLFPSIRERILVCVSTYPNSSQLLPGGARLATQLYGDLYLVKWLI
jgi:two-component system sensor histidine kinase KdpD